MRWDTARISGTNETLVPIRRFLHINNSLLVLVSHQLLLSVGVTPVPEISS